MGIGWSVTSHTDEPGIVFCARSGANELPPQAKLLSRTEAAVVELLATGGLPDPVGWFAHNIAAALTMASREIVSWEGEEWAVESGNGEVTVWAEPSDGRTPFSWLRAKGLPADTLIDGYQNDGAFGLSFIPFRDWRLRKTSDDWRRYDESVTAVPDAARADTLEWNPPRRPWR